MATLYFDFGDPESWLACERSHQVLGVVPEWIPVALGAPAFRCETDREAYIDGIERTAAQRDLLDLRWPAGWPGENADAGLLAATYAKRIGKVVGFSLALFRQAYTGGRDPADIDTALLAGAAAEIHPNALIKAVGMSSVRDALASATAAAREAGVRRAPAVWAAGEVFHGDAGLEEAATALEARA